MPTRPKKTTKTGSRALGRELRRLRGIRSLRDISILSAALPSSLNAKPISEAGLCEIESGKSMPGLQTLYALSVIYRRSVSELISHVIGEQCQSRVQGCIASKEEAVDRFAQFLLAEDWWEALRVATAAQVLATTETEVLAWKLNRAACLARVRLIEEAMALYSEGLSSPALRPHQRVDALFNLTRAHVVAGNLWCVVSTSREALALAERTGVTALMHHELEIQLARGIIESRMEGLPTDDASIREAMRLIESARTRHPAPTAVIHAVLDLESVRAQICLGNALVAIRDAERLLELSRKLGETALEARVHFELAGLRRQRGAHAAAAAHYEQCFALTCSETEPDDAFDAAFELYRMLAQKRPGKATQMLQQCERLYPRLSRRSRRSAAYEEVVRSRGHEEDSPAPSVAPRQPAPAQGR